LSASLYFDVIDAVFEARANTSHGTRVAIAIRYRQSFSRQRAVGLIEDVTPEDATPDAHSPFGTACTGMLHDTATDAEIRASLETWRVQRKAPSRRGKT
jgi:hypothetical protein